MGHIHKIVVAHSCRILKICLKSEMLYLLQFLPTQTEYFTLITVSLEKLP